MTALHLAVLLCSALGLGSACSIPVGQTWPSSVGFKYTMYTADVVLVGKTISQTNKTYDVTFEVNCVLKSSNKSGDIGRKIIINGMYYFHSCTTTYLEMGMEYVIALQDRKENDETFLVDEPDIASSAAYLLENVNTADLTELCGFQSGYAPKGMDPAAAKCPTSIAVPTEECKIAKPEKVIYPNPNGVWRVEYGVVLLLVVSLIHLVKWHFV